MKQARLAGEAAPRTWMLDTDQLAMDRGDDFLSWYPSARRGSSQHAFARHLLPVVPISAVVRVALVTP